MPFDWQTLTQAVPVLFLAVSLVGLSYRYVLSIFINELESTSKKIKTAFAITSGLSSFVFFLIWAEFGQWIPAVRAIAWHTSLAALLVLMVVVLPLMLDLTYFSEGSGITNRYHIFFSLLTFSGQLYVFYLAGNFMPQDTTATQTFFTACMLRVCFMGVSAMALVSGFGAVSALWNVVSSKRFVSEFELVRIKQNIETSAAQSEVQTRHLQKLEARALENGGLFARLLVPTSSYEIETAHEDLSGILNVHNSFLADLTAAQAAVEEQNRSKTTIGLMFKTFDLFFSLYCLYRICATAWNLSPWKSDSLDPVSRIITVIAAHYDEDIDQATWATSIGFMLSGIVMMGSFRACLLVLARMSKILPRLINQHSMTLIFAQLIGLYNVATAIVLCRNLPSDFGRNIRYNLGASLDQSRFDTWFDGVFLVSCLATAAMLYIQQKVSAWDPDDLRIESEKRV